jgi:hypothetical protein
MATLPLPLGSYRLPAPAASCRRLVNCFAQQAPPDSSRGQPILLHRAPGIASWGDTEATECRGATIMGGVLYVCAGDEVFSVDSNGNATALSGDSVSGNGPVRMAANLTSFVVCPGNGDMFTSDGAAVTESADATVIDGDGVADPAFVDGYIALRRLNRAQIINSGLNALTFNALDVFTAEGATDNLTGLIANNRELIAPGETSTERWYNAGQSPGSPFARSPQGFYEIGCAAGRSLVNQDNAPLMLANDKTFRKLTGAWERVSQHGIESILQRISLADCNGMAYRQEGHHFVAWTFRSAGRTLVLDMNTGEFHERESLVNTVSLGYWRPAFIIEAYGRQIVGDSQSGLLGYLDPDTRTEWGEPQVCQQTFQPIYASGKNALHRSFEIKVTGGQGLLTGQGENPMITLFISDDGGNTFRAKPSRSMGRIGEYERRVRWGGLGCSSDRVYMTQFSDPVRVMTLDAQYDAEGAMV